MAAEFIGALASAGDAPVLNLLDGPYITYRGRRFEPPESSQRLLVFVALNGGRVDRRAAAGTLWPVGDDPRAAGNLRSALWRLKKADIDLIDNDKRRLYLRGGTIVDVCVASDWAARLIDGRPHQNDLVGTTWRSIGFNLLPGWYDEWVVFERERLRQRLMHGLEALSRHLVLAHRLPEAVEAAMAAVAIDPLRESAQRALIEAHLAEGNVGEARRTYGAYQSTVIRELQVSPSAELTSLAHGHRDGCGDDRGPRVGRQSGKVSSPVGSTCSTWFML
jgi:DNA-binding SARP family transcriptional activator